MPQAILLQSVESLGEPGEVVDVSKGYLRNFLEPRKLAQPATDASLKAAAARTAAAERAAAEVTARAEETAALLRKTVLTIEHQAGDDGRLFGSVTAQEIVDAVQSARAITLDRRGVRLSEPIRSTGTHMITVEISDGVTAEVKTIVTAE